MLSELSVDDYVDYKYSQNEWVVARIVGKENDNIKLRLDGMSSKQDATIKINSYRLAPFRKYSRGFTGTAKTVIRDDQNIFDLAKIEEKIGRTPESSKIWKKQLNKKFNEALTNQDLLVTKKECAFSHFIFELFENLEAIFKQNQRSEKFFENICPKYSEWSKFKSKRSCTKSNSSFAREDASQSETIELDLMPIKKEQDNLEYHLILLDYFIDNGGFSGLLNLIYHQSNSINGFVSYHLIGKIIKFMNETFEDLNDEDKIKLLIEIKDRLYQRTKNISDKELKELDMNQLKKVFEQLGELIEKYGNYDLRDEFKFNKENEELNLYLRLIDLTSFDKKLKGMNGIREYVSKLEIENEIQTYNNVNIQKQTLKYFTPRIFYNWIINNKLIENIFTKDHHIEIIKRSSEILKFMGQNSKVFPEYLLDQIWNCTIGKREEVVLGLHGLILDILPSLNLKSAEYLFEKLLKVEPNNYDEDFLLFLIRFTEKGLRFVIQKSRDYEAYSLKVLRVPDELKRLQFFGVNHFYKLTLDNSPLSRSQNNLVLDGLKNIIMEFPVPIMLSKIIENCINNIRLGESVYQSLSIVLTYHEVLFKIPSWEELCLITCERLESNHNILEYLVEYLKNYSESARKRLNSNYSSQGLDGNATRENILVGNFEHVKVVEIIIRAITFFGSNPYMKKTLNPNLFEKLWLELVIDPVFPQDRTYFINICLSYFYANKNFINQDNMFSVFQNIFCNSTLFDQKNITDEKFKLFEAYFWQVNYYADNVQKTHMNSFYLGDNLVRTKYQIIGMETLRTFLLECQNSEMIEKIVNLLVNINTKLNDELKRDENFYHELIRGLMFEVKQIIEVADFRKLEKIIHFLSRYLEKFKKQYTYRPSEINNPLNKIKLTLHFPPYFSPKEIEISNKDKVGYLAEKIRQIYSIDQSEFEIKIDDNSISNQYFDCDIGLIIAQGPVFIQKIEPEVRIPELILVSNSDYQKTFLEIFEKTHPDTYSNIWLFFNSLQFIRYARCQFENDAEGLKKKISEFSFHHREHHNLNFLIAIVLDLSIDPYYWKFFIHKFPKLDLQPSQVIKPWCQAFIDAKGFECLINLLTDIDCSQIDNFLHIKTLISIYQLINILYLSFEEQKYLLNGEFFLKSLEILLKIAILRNKKRENKVIFDNDYSYLMRYILAIFNNMISYDNNFCSEFFNYKNLNDLLIEIFLGSGTDQMFGENFTILLNEMFDKVKNTDQSSSASKIFELIFGKLVFSALANQNGVSPLLEYLSKMIRNYNLVTDFNYNRDLHDVIKVFADYVMNYNKTDVDIENAKLDKVLNILYYYLNKNQEKIEYFGGEIGLVQEILEKGLLNAPSYDKPQGPKYPKHVMITALNLLALLGSNQNTLMTMINYLSPILIKGIWRFPKASSWTLNSNIKRRSNEFSGLKNMGCTCYMNSTLQQIYMIPTLRSNLLKIEDLKFEADDEENNILFQLKRLFFGLGNIDKEYFSPRQFCLSFKDIDGSPISFAEQKDAFEFLSLFFDRFEEQTKGGNGADTIKAHFGGIIANDLICKECPHRYEREEPFFAINLPVKGKKNLKTSLESFIEGEVLEGENAYECEQCKMKVKAFKRASFKKLPNYLIFVLKRFEFDFDNNQKVKINDYLEFPYELDVDPFTQQYLTEHEKLKRSASQSQIDPKSENIFTLKGSVIHLGVADSGHYYSIIRNTKEENGKTVDDWIEFNDTKVSSVTLKELFHVGFGEREGQHSYQNSYILIYEKKKKTQEFFEFEQKFNNEKTIIVEEDIPEAVKLERKAILDFRAEILEKNQRLFYTSIFFSQEFATFLLNLRKNVDFLLDGQDANKSSMAEENLVNQRNSIDFKYFEFMLLIYYTIVLRKRDAELQDNYWEWISKKIDHDSKKCELILQQFSSQDFALEFLLQCSNPDYRLAVSNLVKAAFRKKFEEEMQTGKFVSENGSFQKCVSTVFLSNLISIMPKARNYLRNFAEYFKLIKRLAKIDDEITRFLLENKIIGKLGAFLYFDKIDSSDEVFALDEDLSLSIDPFLEYGEQMQNYPPAKDDDFFKKEKCDITSVLDLAWNLLQYTYIPTIENHKSCPLYRENIEYALTEKDLDPWEIEDEETISDCFTRFYVENKRAICLMSRIVGYLSFNNRNYHKRVIKYILGEMRADKFGKRSLVYRILIKKLVEIPDFLTDKKIETILMEGEKILRESTWSHVETVMRVLDRLISYVPRFSEFAKSVKFTNKIAEILSETIPNYERENIKPSLTANFENSMKFLKWYKHKYENEESYSRDVDSESDGTSEDESRYQKGQKVKYTEDEYIFDARIDNIYEDILKIKYLSGSRVLIKFIESDSHLIRPVVDERTIRPNPADTETNSTTEDISAQSYQAGE